MDRRPVRKNVREQYVRVEEAKYRLCPPPYAGAVILERRDIRMSESQKCQPPPSGKKQETSEKPAADPSKVIDPTGGARPKTRSPSAPVKKVPSSPSAIPKRTKSVPAAAARGAEPTSPIVPKVKISAAEEDGAKQPSIALVQTSPVAAPFVVPKSPHASPRLGHRIATSPTSAIVTTPVTLPSASATIQAPLVGGKRPLPEESPIIILTEHKDEENQDQQHAILQATRTAGMDVPESVPITKRQEPTKQEPLKPDPSNQQVSTQPPSPSPEGGKPGVQFSSKTSKRNAAHVMEFFEEQEKTLQQSFLSLPKRPVRKQRSPSPLLHHSQPSVGLEHLDNLIKLMEQLSSLKDENFKLRRRCDYLESTKVLLEAKQELSFDGSSSAKGFMTLPSKHHHRHHQAMPHQQRAGRIKHGGEHMTRFPSEPGTFAKGADGGGGGGRLITRPRLSSADELEYLEMIDSSSDQRPKRPKSAMHKRSFSTGSLEIPSDLLEKVNGVEGRKRMKSKTGRSIFGGKHSGSKQKSKSSKWARVKKVLTGQKLYEDLGTTIRSLKELGRSSHVRYSTSGAPRSPHEVSPSSVRGSSLENTLGIKEGDAGGRSPLSLPPAMDETTKSSETDLSSEIWMGPPDWWEDYEAHKESGGTSTNSEVSSVIEVTTMYLGKKDATTTATTTTTSSLSVSSVSPMTTSAASTSSMSSSGVATSSSQERYLTVDSSLPRRQSSPSLGAKEGPTEEEDEEDLLEELTLVSSSSRILHKSSSCKSADLELPKELSISPKSADGRESKKFHKTAWGRVKDIIHTRKDSIKKKPKRDKSSGFDSEETSEVDMETLLEDQWRSDSFGEGLLSRSTPKTSPTVMRPSSKSVSESPPRGPKSGTPKVSLPMGPGATNVDMAALLAGSMSDEFSKKMQEWEEKRTLRTRSVRASMDDSELGSADASSASYEVPVRTMDLRDFKGKVPDSSSEGPTPEESSTSMEVHVAHSVNVEEMQRRMTESFSRKMQEWERLKYKSSPASAKDGGSPDMERKGSKGRKDDRQKSKRSREEKEKEKWERQRERDKQKVEREQVKLEKEKLRIEKERLRALEREAKLEKLKGRLSQSEMDPYFKNPVLSPLAEYKVTADFARKLHEWELMRGLSHDVSNSIYLEAQKLSMEHLRETGQQLDTLSKHEQARLTLEGGVREELVPQGGPPGEEPEKPAISSSSSPSSPPPVPPLSLQPYWDSPEDTSPVEKYSETSLGDDETCTSVTDEVLTKSNIATMERANTQLLTELQKKEMEYANVQEDVNKVNEKLARVREEHAKEMARFHRELAQGSITSPVKLEVGDLESTMGELEEKIKLMENFGEKLAMSMESAAVGKWQSIEGEEAVHNQLVDLVDQMRKMLIQASQSEEQSQKSMALSNFETLYSQAMKLQVQMNNLRLSHLERNREIMQIKRQLLLQEVNNLLLQADITRRETELYQFQEARRFASPKRWNTFGGTDRQRPQAQIELATAAAARSIQRRDMSGKVMQPRVNIPYIAEDVLQASAASSSLSAPASPSAIAAAGSGTPQATHQSHSSSTAASRERSTDHVERHLLTPHTLRGIGGESQMHHRHQVAEGAAENGDSKATSSPSQQRGAMHLPSSSQASTHLRIQTSPSLSPSPFSSATPSPSSSPALETTTRLSVTPDDSMDQSVAHTTTEADNNVCERKKTEEHLTNVQQKFKKPGKTSESLNPDIVTMSDSAPLHKEIEELKRVKSKVERGSPTLMKKQGQNSSPVPSPGKSSRHGNISESPDQSIPKQRSLDEPKLTKAASIIDDDYSPALSVMECTDSPTQVETNLAIRDSELGAVGGTELLPPVAEPRREYLPPTSDQSRPGSRSPRSPVSKQKLLRRQREERDVKTKDYKAISPKGSPIAARGKPPLPRQTTPIKQSPSASPAIEKGPRSKSVGDMEPGPPDSPSSKPLQDVINKFEKRATVCETEDRPIELRKTPSPTLHLPRVGLVSRIRRLKPAAELLEESQRYRSGHSIYATRIMQKYVQKEEQHSSALNKENASGSYVHAIVQRLSRETTPVRSAGSSKTTSNASLHRADTTNRSHSELVSTIVRQLSSASNDSQKNGSAPLKDLTNEGHVKQLRQAFNGKSSPERTLSESDIEAPVIKSSSSKAQHRKSCEVAMVLASSTSPTSEASYELVSSGSIDVSQPDDSSQGPINHKSLPTLAPSAPSPVEEAARGRAATYCAPEEAKQSTEIDQPSSKKHTEGGKKGKSKDKKQAKSRESKGDAGRLFSSSLSPERQGARRRKLGTVGVLCKQSISFDLGVSLYTHKAEMPPDSKSRKPRSWDPSESARAEAAAAAATAEGEPSSPGPSQTTSSQGASSGMGRPVSSSSEGEMPPSSPTTEEKKKHRRFLDSSWLQKSKKFFKVSK